MILTGGSSTYPGMGAALRDRRRAFGSVALFASIVNLLMLAFIRKYIFPGAYVPALSETFAVTECCALWCVAACSCLFLRLPRAAGMPGAAGLNI